MTVRTRLIAGGITVVCAAVAAGIFIFAQLRGGVAPATAFQVVQRAEAHASQVTAGIGPNTTLHEVVILHVTPAKAQLNHEPVATRAEGWLAFGNDGKLMASIGFTTDLSGKTLISYQYLAPGGALIEKRPGQAPQTLLKPYALTASGVAAAFDQSINMTQQQIINSGQAAPTDASGNYVISINGGREYIDPHTYRLVKSEDLNQDGSVRETREYPALDVADGNAVPTVVPTVTAFAGTAASTPPPTATPTP